MIQRRRSITRLGTGRIRLNGVFSRKGCHVKRTRFRQLPAEPKQGLAQDETAVAVVPPAPPKPTPSVHVDVDLGSEATELTDSP